MAICPRATATSSCRCTTFAPFRIRPSRSPRRQRTSRIRTTASRAAADGLHIYNRDGHHIAADPFAFFEKLGVEKDGAHAFYLGYELAKAEIARALGKRYAQDSALDWGVAADRKSDDLTQHAPEGATLKAARKEKQDAAHRRNDRDDDEREG